MKWCKIGRAPRLEHGSNPLAYWFGCIIFAGAALGFAAIVYRSINTEAWSTTLFIVVFFGYLLWQTGSFIRRNRPGDYRLDALPAALMPVRQS